MATYRSKPATIEAEQFTHPATAPLGVYIDKHGDAFVLTIHGQRTTVVPGDWIIREPDGVHCYPCKPAVFEKRWELAD